MLPRFFFTLLIAISTFTIALPSAGAQQLSSEQVKELSRDALFGAPDESAAALAKLDKRGNPDVVASLILGMRFIRADDNVLNTLSSLTGAKISSWNDAMLWQEAHPEVKPHASYQELKLTIFRQIDPNFMQFLGDGRSNPENMDIRLEEIAWGGVVVDGIPSLDNPKLIDALAADYMLDDDLVFGVSINGDVRAYPLRIMGWHEMFNEVIGGVPVALAYCTLCGAGILFETKVDGHDDPLIFGSSGFLYRSNKLMFDRKTNSLWNQFTGEPVSGPLRGTGIKLKIRPVAITSWKNWKTSNPSTKVLDLDTGFRRDYGSGVVYNDYFSSPNLMFPALVGDEKIAARKDFVFGIRDVGAAKAWPIKAFKSQEIINDSVGSRKVVLIGNGDTRTVRAYDRGEHNFSRTDDQTVISDNGTKWKTTEDELISDNGDRLARIAGHISYWFAWDGYLGVKSELYQPVE